MVWVMGGSVALHTPSCGCKSRHELVTVGEVKRNGMRVTECGKEAWGVNREPMNKNRIEGAAKQGERALSREALVTKARWRKCGGCAMKLWVSPPVMRSGKSSQ